jgi:MoaA/NifB/PqqE/SkfB family radical SAM enzyme
VPWLAKRFGLTTGEWTRLLAEASDLGIVQVDFTGGEPLARLDIQLYLDLTFAGFRNV